jgi:hypothetical protein
MPPDPTKFLAAFVKFPRKDQTLSRIVNAKPGYGVTVHTPLCRGQADIGAIQVEVRKIFVELQA